MTKKIELELRFFFNLGPPERQCDSRCNVELLIITWWSDHTFSIKISSTTTVTNCLEKCDHCVWIWHMGCYKRCNDELMIKYMMILPYFSIKTSSKTTVTNCLKKCDHCVWIWHMGSYKRCNDELMIITWWYYHSFQSIHHQKQQLPIASKSVTTAYEFGTWGPIRDVMMNWW